MKVRKLTKELERTAKDELNEVPTRVQEDVQHIREWLQKQPHLIFPDDDQMIVLFLRVCKYRLQETKERIDNFCTMVTLSPEFLSDGDPLGPEIQTILSANIIAPLPNRIGVAEPRIVMMRFNNCNSEKITFLSLVKIWFMSILILMDEDDDCAVCGLNLLVDCREFPLSYIPQANFGLLRKIITFVQKTNPIRIKGINYTNVHSAVETIYHMVKHLLSEKLRKRIIMYNTTNSSEAYKAIHKSLLPKEYGGNGGSFDDLAAAWKQKVESCRHKFLNDKIFYSKEDIRPGQSNALSEFLGIEGSFRKLDID